MSGSRILIVEDEFLIRLTLAEALTDEGFEVSEAASGDEALALLEEEDGIELLLTDIQLPGTLDGIGLARAARKRAPDLPVIYVTGRPDALEAAGGSGRDVFISKPYLPSEVCAAARRLTGR
ncbi:MAG: response regulator [Acidisphaera sp.]|nr:response regulator [Acidisphaera sp.]